MAMYKRHAKFNIFIALPILLGVMYYFLHPVRGLMLTFSGAFVYSTLFMNPDLDLANQIRVFSIRGFLTFPFRSYAKFFSHRGLSHNVVLGSFTRIAWLMGWGFLSFLVFYKTLPSKEGLLSLYEHYQPFILYGLAGVCLADWGHLLLDRKKG
ncbi:MAG: DUF2227 family putative metal-binding protein [Candidatus Neptunochlamydia sp.]|nr:DUF2227 family putative metal-binding protein [Candidatus Neptunochlamydia sp.]